MGQMMTHEELKEKFLKGFGGKVPYAARESWGQFLRSKAASFSLRYEWIKHEGFWNWISTTDIIDFDDGQEWIRVFSYGDLPSLR